MSRAAAPLALGFMVHGFPVYSETFVAELARGLVGEGHSLDILAMGGVGRGDAAWPELSDHVRYPPRLPGAETALGAFAAQALMLRSARRFDVMHCQFATTGLLAMRHARYRTLRTRALVVHLRGHDITTFVDREGPDVYDALFRRADLFIANCAHFRERAIALGCPAGKVIVIGSPIDTDRFSPPPGRTPPGGRPIRLVAVGRLVEKKGFADAIDATARLVGEARDVRLDILGDGPLREALEAQVARLALADRIRFHGASAQQEVLAALHAADIALTPSVRAASGDEDAAVNTAKEAMATELPVIGTRHGGIPELVIPGENGDLVPERDPAALAAAIARMIDDPASWPVLGRSGRRKVVTEYGQRAVVRRTLDAYRMAMTSAGETA